MILAAPTRTLSDRYFLELLFPASRTQDQVDKLDAARLAYENRTETDKVRQKGGGRSQHSALARESQHARI